jgi:hypothetical protein
MKAPKKFVGTWRITETEVWDEGAIDLVVPVRLTITANGLGSFQMVAVQGDIDCRFEGDRVEFSWVGDDRRLRAALWRTVGQGVSLAQRELLRRERRETRSRDRDAASRCEARFRSANVDQLLRADSNGP